MIPRLFILAAGLSVLLPVFVLANDNDIRDQRDDLQEIQAEVANRMRRLDSLKSVELKTQKKIGEFDQKITSNRKVVKRLNRELTQLRSEIKNSELALSDRTDHLEYSRRRYLGSIRQFYITTRHSTEQGLDRPNIEVELNRKITYLSALAGFESGSVETAELFLGDALVNMDQLKGQKKKISRMKQSKESSTSLERSKKRKSEKDLAKIRRKKIAEADRILMLEQASLEIESIIARLEQKQRRNNRRANALPSVFAAQKGQLRSPYKGRVVVSFGAQVDKTTNLKSFSPGIVIAGKAGRIVVAVASGEIAHVGKLRGYGNFIIINHDDQYYTTYAGLGQANVISGQFVGAGSKLAVSGSDGRIRFEIRQGRQAVDPVEWIKFESF